MALLQWDVTGTRTYETGVDHGVLYIPNASGVYDNGVAWNGLTTVTESPSGAEANPQYADNIKYLNLLSAEEFGATIEAFTYPPEFIRFDGGAVLNGGVQIGQQSRGTFGLSYRTKIGNDLLGSDYGYKLHLIYGAQAAPSEKAYATVNDSPEAITFSWELTTTAAAVGTIGTTAYKPTASITVDSTKVTPESLAVLEGILYGKDAAPRLPEPSVVIGLLVAKGTAVTQTAATLTPVPTAVTPGKISIPPTTGVDWVIDGVTYSNTTTQVIDFGPGTNKLVYAQPKNGFAFPEGTLNVFRLTKVA